MAIEVDIPVEIEDYEEKILFGLSLRQLLCLAGAVVLSIGSYFVATKVFGLSMDAASYLIILEALPLMCIGFIRKDGQPFEKYFALFLRQKIGNNKLFYASGPNIGGVEPVATAERGQHHVHIWNYRAKNEKRIREASIYIPTPAIRKRARKKAIARIKAAQKECSAAKRRTKKKSPGDGGAEKHS